MKVIARKWGKLNILILKLPFRQLLKSIVALNYSTIPFRCTGNGTNLGPGGCNSCMYAVERRKDQVNNIIDYKL
jgi:hypothetical protein